MISLHDIDNRQKTIVCLLLSLFLLQITLSAEAFNLRKINNPENLSSGIISSIHQDEKGLIWIGTNRGLDIYDGKRVVKYCPEHNENFFTGSNIHKIMQANDSLLWLQTYHGLHKINLESTDIESFDMFNRISFLDKDDTGNIYLIQGNYCIYYKLRDQEGFEQLFVPDLKASDIVSFFIDNSGKLWIFQKNGINLCFSVQVNKQGTIVLEPLSRYKHSTGILYGTSDDNHTSYFVDDTYALYEFDTSLQKPLFVCDLTKYLPEKDDISSLIKFHNDYFIGFQTKGLSLLKKSDRGYILEEVNVPGGINCLYKDKFQDLVWIGTSGNGVYLYSNDMYSIQSVHLDNFSPGLHRPVSAIWVDGANTLWLGSKGEGILRIFNFQADKKVEEHRVEMLTANNSRLRDNVILSLAESRLGNLWIGSEKGLSYFDCKRNHISSVRLLSGKKDVEFISDIDEQDSILWISTLGMGIIKANIEWRDGKPILTVLKQITIKEGDKYANCFQDIYSERDSLLWCMNRGEGIYKLNMITLELENIRFEGYAINETNVIRKDYRGDYLIGTNFGLVKYNSNGYKLLNETSGFPTNSVYGILFDSHSDYWLSTNRGLISYNTDTESIRGYDHHDGLSVLEFNEGASFRDARNDILYFGGTNGFVTVARNYFDEGQHYMPLIYFININS